MAIFPLDRRPRRPLWPLLAVAAVLASGAGALAVGERFIAREGQVHAGIALQRAEAAADVAGQFVQRSIDDIASLQVLAQRWVLLDAADARIRQELEGAMRQMLRDRGDRRTPFLSVVILAADGALRWSTNVMAQSFNAGDRDYFVALRDGFRGTFLTAPQVGRGTGLTVILAAQALQDRDGAFAGTMMVGLDPGDLSRSLASIAAQDGDVVALLRRQGEVLARVQRGAPAEAPTLVGQVPASHGAWSQTLAATNQASSAGRNAFTGVEQFRAVRALPDTNLAVFAAVETEAELKALPALQASIRLMVGGFVAAGLVAVGAGVAVTRAARLRMEAAALHACRSQVERLHRGLPVVLFLRDSIGPHGPSRLLYRGGDVERVTGWTDGRLNGLADWTPYLAQGTPWIDDCVADALGHGTTEYDWQLRQPDGRYRWMSTVLVRVAVRPDGGGEVVGYTRDVTAQYEAAQRAEAARVELDQTLGAAPVVVFRGQVAGDGSFRKTFMSRGIERMTGWAVDDVVRQGGLRGIVEEPARLVEQWALVAAEGASSSDHAMRCADGRVITVVVTMEVMDRLPDGRMEVVGYIADVTAEREAKARAITSARLASLGEMSAGLAHELKQPLQAITLAATNTQSALERGDAAAAGQRLQRIIGYARRAADVIEHLRRFARGTEADGQPQPVPVQAAIAGVQSLVGASLRDSMVDLVVTLGDPPPVVLGQLVALEQVLSNLIMNARDAVTQHGAEGPRRIEVEAVADPAAGQVRISVADTGGGLPAAVLARLFQPFVSTKGPDRGTGLGLSICHGLVTGMGGTIAASNEGPGAVFRITLPAAPAE
ncbi:ATP-binding protein [Falsiroseomonas ponticola]|uniref:ATP-binding protein n=1 Tax=Falsiroseomonas ponticola TaxID=2786951 RepID=UPI00193429CE|nr:ATP-binding protein [Roseomonas ponticola]